MQNLGLKILILTIFEKFRKGVESKLYYEVWSNVPWQKLIDLRLV